MTEEKMSLDESNSFLDDLVSAYLRDKTKDRIERDWNLDELCNLIDDLIAHRESMKDELELHRRALKVANTTINIMVKELDAKEQGLPSDKAYYETARSVKERLKLISSIFSPKDGEK